MSDPNRYAQLTQERDMAEAYLNITERMGPSAQLLAFINHDGSLSQELGIGLEAFDTETQHDLLVQSIDLEKMDVAATEALVENVRDLARGLGAASRVSQKAYLGGGHSTLGMMGNIGQLAAQVVIGATNHLVSRVEDYNEIALTYNDTLELFKLEEHIGDMMPDGFTEQEWTNFHERVHPAIKKYNRSWITWGLAVPKSELHPEPVEWSHAGWTEAKYRNIQEKLNKLRTEVNKLSGEYSTKLQKVEAFLKSYDKASNQDRKQMKNANATINKLVISTKSMFMRTYQRIDFMQEALNEVKPHFDK